MKTTNNNTFSTSGYGRILILALALVIIGFTQVQGQNYKVTAGSQIKVAGTSNLHDWTMLASNFICEGNFVVKDGQLQDITSLSFELPVANLKSKEDLLNTRAYKSLKADAHKKITFKLTGATVMPQQKIKATGNLTIAGVTRAVTLQSSYIVNSDGVITCKGSETVKMSDYGIKAPSFMMGALKTGNEVIIDILLKLKK